MTKFDDYATKYQTVRMERHNGILQMTLHTNGGPLRWGFLPHGELPEAFYDVGADHDLGREGIEHQQEHHDDAAGADGSDTDQKAADESNETHSDEVFQSRFALGEVSFDPSLK